MTMIELRHDALEFRFLDVHADARCRIDFQRTLRIPDDNRDYPLPPGLGRFPLQHVDDFADRLPAEWPRHGGVFLPMYQAEALWINFHGDYPCAVKIAAGKINAVTGNPWTNKLSQHPQDYVVVPAQPWLDGFAIDKGLIRQFVAMPLGEGFSAEEQLTGAGIHGGIQVYVYPMKRQVYEELRGRRSMKEFGPVMCDDAAPSMGLAAGGLMRQDIYEDEYGIDVWDQNAGSRCFVHLMNSVAYLQATKHLPPQEPPSAANYTKAGLPWFDYFDAERKALAGAAKLAGLDSVAATSIKKGEGPVSGNDPIHSLAVTAVGPSSRIVEGEF
jgi:hypothetical protein